MHNFSYLIEHAAVDFGLVKIERADMLERIRQTAFSWTNTPASICLAVNKKYYQQAFQNLNVVAIVAPPSALLEDKIEQAVVICENADEFFYYLHNMALHRIAGLPDNSLSKSIADSAVIAETAIIGEHVVIGEEVIIEHDCMIMDNTVIGDKTIIGPKCVIGVDGFFTKRIRGQKEHLQHFGGVRIGRKCKFHSDITVARSVNYAEYTEIGDMVHVGHKTIIGHDSSIGHGTDISVMALIAGRVNIGENCWIGANASISNACMVGNGASVRIGAVVISHVPSDAEVSGNFAIAHRSNLNKFIKER